VPQRAVRHLFVRTPTTSDRRWQAPEVIRPGQRESLTDTCRSGPRRSTFRFNVCPGCGNQPATAPSRLPAVAARADQAVTINNRDAVYPVGDHQSGKVDDVGLGEMLASEVRITALTVRPAACRDRPPSSPPSCAATRLQLSKGATSGTGPSRVHSVIGHRQVDGMARQSPSTMGT